MRCVEGALGLGGHVVIGVVGVGRIDHILRVHGHTILEEQSAAAVSDEISLERLFSGAH